MSEAGFLQERKASAGSLTIVIALHAAAVSALLLWKTEFVTNTAAPFIVKHIRDAPPPPPEPIPPETKPTVRQKSVLDQVKPIIPVERPTEFVLEKPTEIIPFNPGPIGESLSEPTPIPLPEPRPIPVPEPVRTDAVMLASSQLQPPYPAAEERAENEGSVTVRVLIGTDGRVKAVEKVRGDSDAFFRSTEQQALRHWRFKPATVDGRPVESRRVMTVHFRLAA